jgi:hypothetical protein
MTNHDSEHLKKSCQFMHHGLFAKMSIHAASRPVLIQLQTGPTSIVPSKVAKVVQGTDEAN